MLKRLYESALHHYRLSKLEQLDWITRNKVQLHQGYSAIERSAQMQGANKQKDNSQLKILFWGVMPWERGGVEHMIATAMKARGHKVYGAKCDGGIAACSMESILYPRPDCDACFSRHQRLLEAWKLNDTYHELSRVLSKDLRQEIESKVDQCSDEQLSDFTLVGLPIGRLALQDLPQFFFRLVDLDDPEIMAFYRRSIKAIASYAVAANKMLDDIAPDRAITTSGRTIAFTGFFQLCQKKGIPVITWDESIGGHGAFIFASNDIAVNYNKPKAWEQLKDIDLSSEEEAFVSDYFKQTEKGTFGRHQYYSDPISDKNIIRDQLHLDPKKPLTVLLTNLTWDTSALKKDVAFDSMLDWLNKTIDFSLGRPEHQIIIRTHPAEGHLASYAKGCESVASLLQQTYPELPPHIKVISGHDELNSHSLCSMADQIAVYTTTVGIEMAMKGREVMVIGQSHYRGKGFTTDIDTQDEYFERLIHPRRHAKHIEESQIKCARRYAHYFIVKTEVYLDEFNHLSRHEYHIEDPKAYLPGGSRRWDALCQNIEHVGDFISCTDYLDKKPN